MKIYNLFFPVEQVLFLPVGLELGSFLVYTNGYQEQRKRREIGWLQKQKIKMSIMAIA